MITLITGGIKSGKSDFAANIAEEKAGLNNCYFVATAKALDDEMAERIKLHKSRRNDNWKLVEEPLNPQKELLNLPENSVVLLDCLTLWLMNLIEAAGADSFEFIIIEEKISELESAVREKSHDLYIITNEVGSGIIPDNKLSRLYGDNLGKANQKLSSISEQVFLMVSGIALKIK